MARTKNCGNCCSSKRTSNRLYDNKKSTKSCSSKNCAN